MFNQIMSQLVSYCICNKNANISVFSVANFPTIDRLIPDYYKNENLEVMYGKYRVEYKFVPTRSIIRVFVIDIRGSAIRGRRADFALIDKEIDERVIREVLIPMVAHSKLPVKYIVCDFDNI